MTAHDARKLRNLLWAHLKRPDPFNWLVAADLLEEHGRDEEASKWRWRGHSYPALVYAIETRRELRQKHDDDRPVHFLIGTPGNWLLGYTDGSYMFDRVYVLKPGTRDSLTGGYWLVHRPAEELTKDLIALIDRTREAKK